MFQQLRYKQDSCKYLYLVTGREAAQKDIVKQDTVEYPVEFCLCSVAGQLAGQSRMLSFV